MPHKCVGKYSAMHCATGYKDDLVHLNCLVLSYDVHVYLCWFVFAGLESMQRNRFRVLEEFWSQEEYDVISTSALRLLAFHA